jgi:hypothetical protein
VSDKPFDPAEIADQYLAKEAVAAEADGRRRQAERLRADALYALARLQHHTCPNALSDALSDRATAPAFREAWGGLVVQFGLALASLPGAVERLAGLALGSQQDEYARRVLAAACSGDGGRVRELLETAWRAGALVLGIKEALCNRIPDALLYPKPPPRAERDEGDAACPIGGEPPGRAAASATPATRPVQPASPPETQPETPSHEQQLTPAYQFQLVKKIWRLRFEGEHAEIPEEKSVGLGDIALLLQCPHKGVTAVELRPAPPGTHEQRAVDPAVDRAFDSEGARQYEAEERRLRNELDDAIEVRNEETAAKLKADLDHLTEFVSKQTNRYGKARLTQTSRSAKAADAVRKRLEHAYGVIKEEAPRLAAHLRDQIKKDGTTFTYHPEVPGPDWRL